MNERIRELVKESNLDLYSLGAERYRWEYTVEKFAELVAQDEREACADIADQHNSVEGIAQKIAAEIRRRG